MSRNKVIWTPTRDCDCCGKRIVLLRNPEWKEGSGVKKWITCYARQWEGNPWFVSGLDFRHPQKKYSIHMWKQEQEKRKTEDPFFTLD